MFDFALSIAVLAAAILLGASFYIWRKQGPNRQALLMAIMSFVLLANVVIWIIPVGGDAGLDGSLSEAIADAPTGGDARSSGGDGGNVGEELPTAAASQD